MTKKNSTQLGEHASLSFHVECLKRKLLIARPLWDCGYDVIVHNPDTHGMWRVQIKKAQGKKAQRPQGGTYWVGSTHRKRGTRYAPGLIDCFAFEKPDGTGFWLVEGKRLDGRAGCGLTLKDWDRWDLFHVKSANELPSTQT
jgi:hypothetical protein